MQKFCNIRQFLSRLVLHLFLIIPAPGLPQAVPDDDSPVILAVGESTTAGFGVAPDQSYPAQLQALLDRGGYHYRVVNHGRSGITTAMALGTLDRGVALQPRIVLLALGGNDRGARFASDRTRENLRRMLKLYKGIGATVFLAERGAATDGGDAAEPSLFAQLAAEEGVLLMPSLREGLAGKPELLLVDMSHPNPDGYAIVAARIYDLLQPHLELSAGK